MSTGLAVEERPVLALVDADQVRASVHVVRGREAVRRLKDMLVELGVRCGQTEVIDDLECFLDQPKSWKKRLCVALVSRSESGPAPARVEELLGAALLYEYQLLGAGSRVFVADYHGAERTVLAPAESRREVAFRACAALLRQGALVAQLSFLAEGLADTDIGQWVAPPEINGRRWRWAAKARTTPGYLRLESSVEETLATLGRHTRRNLRLYRRRAAANLDYEFVSEVETGREEFMAMNRMCPYPVTDALAEWRYEAVRGLENGVLVGLRIRGGEWLSLLGGRQQRESIAIEWQMNRPELPSHSLCTVMRSHLIEHAVERGVRRLRFVGGTTHSLRHSLVEHETVDVVGVRSRLPAWLLRRVKLPGRLKKNFVVQQLADAELHWRRW